MIKNRLAQALSPRGTLRVMRKHWLATLLITTVGSVGTFVTVRALPSRYKAEIVILVESQKIPEKLVSSTVNAELQDRLATISQEILSATRLQSVIDSFNLYEEERISLTQQEVIEQMRRDITIKIERGWTRNQPGAFSVSLLGRDPKQVTTVVSLLG